MKCLPSGTRAALKARVYTRQALDLHMQDGSTVSSSQCSACARRGFWMVWALSCRWVFLGRSVSNSLNNRLFRRENSPNSRLFSVHR